MVFYLAPMEGITGYIYRNAVHEFFGEGIVRYFTPFISPRPKKGMQNKERRDLLPENNKDITLIPQILTKSSEDFVRLAQEICETYGYEEINLNAGCPSRTVVSHGKGAGILKDTDALERFLDDIFTRCRCRISVKTRLGMEQPEEFERILQIYDQYPMTELILHPRVQADQYRKAVRMEDFCKALGTCRMPVVYNGDIFTVSDYKEKMSRIGEPDKNRIHATMLGRGMLKNPALARMLFLADQKADTQKDSDGSVDTDGNGSRDAAGASTIPELRGFHDRIFSSYREIFDGEMPLLFHMKELWASLGSLFPEQERSLKRIRKSKNLAEYLAGVNELL